THLPSQRVCIDNHNRVYIPPEANANTTLSKLASHISSVENSHPDGAIIVLGDFNHTNLSTELPNYHQQVTCPSRGNNTLDHCYTPLKEAYRASAGAPLGNFSTITPISPPPSSKRQSFFPFAIRTLNGL
ncbi:hypothetical protein KUCAC02_013344, partial [Chaenocephalus aceratus]